MLQASCGLIMAYTVSQAQSTVHKPIFWTSSQFSKPKAENELPSPWKVKENKGVCFIY